MARALFDLGSGHGPTSPFGAAISRAEPRNTPRGIPHDPFDLGDHPFLLHAGRGGGPRGARAPRRFTLAGQDLALFVRLLIAVALGALVGFERERSGKAAGLRTHGMVSLGPALFAVVSLCGFGGVGDPARVTAQVVTGIGFLGAGAILHRRGGVQGLTTAAALRVTAALGLAVGLGMVGMSLATTILTIVLLRFGPRPRPLGKTAPPEE